MASVERFTTTIPSLTVATTSASSEEINFGVYSGGFIFVPAGATTATITWYVAEKPGGTYMTAYDEDSVAITQSVAASRAYAIPAALFGARAVKAVGDVAVTLALSLKG